MFMDVKRMNSSWPLFDVYIYMCVDIYSKHKEES